MSNERADGFNTRQIKKLNLMEDPECQSAQVPMQAPGGTHFMRNVLWSLWTNFRILYTGNASLAQASASFEIQSGTNEEDIYSRYFWHQYAVIKKYGYEKGRAEHLLGSGNNIKDQGGDAHFEQVSFSDETLG
eukprot:TCALIF_02658-PA protein Name:"Protein of unknown function" AED:0.80 eAED:0.80 QI:0/0/0/0.5/1/1/4/0/132